jgi:hypothetical protein
MDDNHRLVEWLVSNQEHKVLYVSICIFDIPRSQSLTFILLILFILQAYHYHVLPLRYLIVAVDPRSKTSPTALFNRWRAQGVYIQEWNDRDFWRPDLELKPIPDDAELQTKRDRHRGRQKYFYRSCLVALKKANRTYVTLNDSDEFVVYNHAGGDDYEAWENKMQARHDASVVHGKLPRIKPSDPNIPPPTTGQAGAMIDYIRHEKAAGIEYYQSPCIGIPRLMFGAQESSESTVAVALAETNRQETVPAVQESVIDVNRLDTLRYRHHAHRNDFVKNALGKVIMDVSLIDIVKSPNFMSLHRPIKTICKAPWHNDWESGLRINHYLGSWESYSFRDDSRRGGERSREQWEYKATTNGEETDDNIRPWLDGFVREHGPDKAKELLDGAGLPEGYRNVNTNPNDTRGWGLLPDKLDKILSTDKTVTNDNKMVAFDAWVRDKYKNSVDVTSSSSPERRH